MILFDVQIGGRNVSSAMQPILKEITVSDGTDSEADTASIVLADVDGQTFMANKRDPVSIKLGRFGFGAGTVFDGFVDEPKSVGGPDGRTINLSCTSVDLEGEAKKPGEDYWDEKTLGDILKGAFKSTGISLMVDPSFASLQREFESMDGRDPLSFAADMAREVGATFKMMGSKAVFAQRNSGLGIAGVALPTFVATWGVNLLSWDISPVRPRAGYSELVNRWFDFAKNEYKEEKASSSSGKVPHKQTAQRATQALAKDNATAGKTGAERDAGAGSITVLGDFRAQAGGKCLIVGARAGVDGGYIISSVEHNATMSGFISTLELKHPEGGAGVDSR